MSDLFSYGLRMMNRSPRFELTSQNAIEDRFVDWKVLHREMNSGFSTAQIECL